MPTNLWQPLFSRRLSGLYGASGVGRVSDDAFQPMAVPARETPDAALRERHHESAMDRSGLPTNDQAAATVRRRHYDAFVTKLNAAHSARGIRTRSANCLRLLCVDDRCGSDLF